MSRRPHSSFGSMRALGMSDSGSVPRHKARGHTRAEDSPVPSRAVVISAHPDDVDFGCAGTVAVWTKQGAKVSYIICTDGDKGSDDPKLAAQPLAELRQREQREAAATVGVEEVVFLGFPDGELDNDLALRKALVAWIRRLRPDVVICQDPANRAFENPFVSHRDHRMAAEAAFDALYPACGNPHFFPELLEQGLLPHKVPELLFFGTHAPNFWQDISTTISLKIQAILCHRSQVADPASLEAFIRERFRQVGQTVGFSYAEPFRKLLLPT